MKTEDSIYIVKGKSKSALINLETREIRTLANTQLKQLADNTDLTASLARYIPPQLDIYQKEILDIKLQQLPQSQNFNFLSQYFNDDIAYFNVRIFCPEKNPIALDPLQTLVTWINNNIFQFGIVIFISDAYPLEKFYTYFARYRVFNRESSNANNTPYQPMLYGSPNAIFISQKNNLYHYSRDTLLLDKDKVQFIDHDQFNIPKSNIEGCKDCAFRLTCFDLREVQQTDGKYHYDTTCLYELDH